MSQFLDKTGLTYWDSKLKAIVGGSIRIDGNVITLLSVDGKEIGTATIPKSAYELASATVDGLMSKSDFVKLDGIHDGATKTEASGTNGKLIVNGSEIDVYIHPSHSALSAGLYKITTNSQGHVTAGTAVTKADLVALGLPSENTTYGLASASGDGLMSKGDFAKLKDISEDANKVEPSSTNGNIKIDGSDVTVYKHDSHTAHASGFYKVTINAQGHVTAVTAVSKSDITALGIPAENTTYGVVTDSKDGLMSAADFMKLGNIAPGAQVNVIEGVSLNGNALPINSKGVNIDLSAYALKSDISTAVEYKGSVATFAALPTNAETGDMYNVEAAFAIGSTNYDAGTNVVWNGNGWDPMAKMFDITPISNAEIDALFE